MTTLASKRVALPSHEIALPPFHVPPFLRRLREVRDEAVTRFRSAMGQGVFPQVMGGTGVTTPWYLSGGITSGQCVAAYQPKGAASLAASYINLNSPGTNNANPIIAPTWSSVNGWVFAASAYLDTGIIPSSSWSMIVRFSNKGGGDYYLCGESDGSFPSARFAIATQHSSTLHLFANGGSANISGEIFSGVLAVAGQSGYLNGSSETTTVPPWSGSTTLSVYLGARHISGAASGQFSGNIQAIAIYNTNVGATAIAALTTAINAL